MTVTGYAAHKDRAQLKATSGSDAAELCPAAAALSVDDPVGVTAMMQDFGTREDIHVKVCTDASAAVGIVHRRGMGRIRRIEVAQLWLQSCVHDGKVKVIKIDTYVNAADALTKCTKREDLERHMKNTAQRVIEGRHEKMPRVIE